MRRLMFALVIVLFSFTAFAEDEGDGWYGSVGVGKMVVWGIKPSNIERQIARYAGQFSSSKVNNKSTYKVLTLGHCFNRYMCLEGTYLWGAKFSTVTTLNNPYAGVVNLGGTTVDLSVLPKSITVRQDAAVSATQVAVVGKVPVTNWLELFGKLGAYDYRIAATQKIVLPQNIFLAEEAKFIGTIPMGSVGLGIKTSKHFGFQFEGTKVGKVRIAQLALVYRR